MNTINGNNKNDDKNNNKNHRFASYKQRRSTSITVLSSDDEHDESNDDVVFGGGGGGGSSSSWSFNDLSASFFYEGRPAPHDFDVEWVLDNDDDNNNTHEKKKKKKNYKKNKSRRNNKNYYDYHHDDDNPALPCNCSSTSSDDDTDENGEQQSNNVDFLGDDDYDYENIRRKVYANMNRRRTSRSKRRRLVLMTMIALCMGIAVVAVSLGLVCTRDKRRNADETASRGTSPDAATATVTGDNSGNVVDGGEDITSLSGDFMDEDEETDEEEEDGGIDEGEDVIVDTSDLEQDNADDSTTNTAPTALTASPTNDPQTSSPLTETATPAIASPTTSPNFSPTVPSPDLSLSDSKSVIVRSNQFLERGEFHSSPSGRYKVGLTADDGQLVLIKVGDRDDGAAETTATVVWSSGVSGGVKCFVQADGNVIVRDSNQNAKWSTETHGNPGAELVVTDQGQIALVDQATDTAIWLQGVPRTTYQGPSSDDMTFPIRGAFYYP